MAKKKVAARANAGKIQTDYRTCLTKIKALADKKGYQVLPRSLDIKIKQEGDFVTIEPNSPLHLYNWPWRPDSNDRICILVDIRETISLVDCSCIESSIRVNYLKATGQTYLLTESMHYDYSSEINANTGTGKNAQRKTLTRSPSTGPQHPICHFQNCSDVVSPCPDSIKLEICDTAVKNRCQNVRVPTAFVNLAGLFSILAADHMKPDHWREFVVGCRSEFDKLPGLPDSLAEKIGKAKLQCWGWYRD